MKTENLDPTKIQREADCQPRAELDDKVVEGLVDLLDGGDYFKDPIVVFRDAEGTQRLADGFHRVKAHLIWCEKNDTVIDITAAVHDGDKQAAIAFAVKANSTHGKRRNSVDLHRAFEIAARHNILDQGSPKDVQAKLGCSLRTAERLTEPHRKASRKRRDDKIQTMDEDGQTHEEIAEEVGVDRATVTRVVHSRQVAETHEAQKHCTKEEVLEDHPKPDSARSGPFDKFKDSLRGFYKDIGNGIGVPPEVREVARHSKACLEAARAGDQVPDELVALLAKFVRDSKNHVV